MSDLLTDYQFEEPSEREHVLFEKGEYEFRFLEINTVVHNAGKNPYIPLKLEFSRADGATAVVYENLVFAPSMKWKIDQFVKCVATSSVGPGRRIDWTDINFIKWLLNRKGRASLVQKPVTGKDYLRNEIDRWVYDKTPAPAAAAPAPPPAQRSAPPPPVDEQFDDDDLPPF